MVCSKTSRFKVGATAAGICALLAAGWSGETLARTTKQYGIGQVVTEGDIEPWNIDVGPDGAGLPPGSGSVADGKLVFDAKCASCHGAQGEGGVGPRLVGGQGTLNTDRPVKTIGSFWPYATTIYDYINRAMPYNAPQSLTAQEVYGVTAYLLNLNGIVPAETVLDAASLPKIVMPNRNGFVPDPRPDVKRSIK